MYKEYTVPASAILQCGCWYSVCSVRGTFHLMASQATNGIVGNAGIAGNDGNAGIDCR